MKKGLIILLCASFLACQPTPEVEFVPNKGDAQDWQQAAVPYEPEETTSSPDPFTPVSEYEQQNGPLYDRVNAPKLWNTEDRSEGYLLTAQDCPVYLPDVEAVPVVEAEKRSFTQADVDALAAAMFPADTVWYPQVLWTKEDVEVMMQETMEEAAKGDPDAAENGHDAKYFEDKLAMYRQRYEEAPFAADIVPITLEINPCQEDYFRSDPNVPLYPGVKAEAKVNGEHWTVSARTDKDDPLLTYLEGTRCADLWIDVEQPLDAPYGVQMTRAEAMSKATAFVQNVAGSEYGLCYCVPIMAHAERVGDSDTYELPARFSQWCLVFMRTFNGCPSAYVSEEVGGDMDSTVTQPIAYERIIVHIDDAGVSYFRWNTPMTVTGVVNANADLISFEDAAARATRQISARWKYDVEAHRERGDELTIYLQRVTFGLWRIAKKNGGYYYVPVYHFFTNAYQGSENWATSEGFWGDGTPRERFLRDLEQGPQNFATSECFTFGGDYWGAVTVNALDGTIIDKDKGY